MSIEELLDRLSIKKCSELLEKIEKELNSVELSSRLLANKEEIKTTRIVSCIVNYFISDVIKNSEVLISDSPVASIKMDNTIEYIKLTEEARQVNEYLERIVQKKVICNCEVARADYNASEIISALFKKYYHNPRLLHTGTLNKIFNEMLNNDNIDVANSAMNLNDGSIKLVNEEIKELTTNNLYEFDKEKEKWELINQVGLVKRKILVRNIVDYIAGMTDGYAIQEYQRLI